MLRVEMNHFRRMIREPVRRSLWLLAAVLLAAGGGAGAADTVPSSIRLANGEWPPFTSAALPGYGSVSQRVSDAFARAGIKVQYQFFPWKRALEEARDGKLDGTLVWAHTADRDADFLYSDPVLVTPYVVFFRKSKPVHWQTLRDLKGLTIGGTLGATPTGEYAELARQGVFRREVADDDELNLRKLAAGHLDAATIEPDVGIYLLKNRLQDIAADIDYDPKPVIVVPNYLLISRKTGGAAELVRRFNLGLAALPAAATVAAPQ